MDKFSKVTFIGFGLINSSLAHIFKLKSLAKETAAFSRSKETREKIKNLNIVDNVNDNIRESVKDSDLVVLGVPVGAMESIVGEIAPFLKTGTIITDVGSVKKHPLAS